MVRPNARMASLLFSNLLTPRLFLSCKHQIRMKKILIPVIAALIGSVAFTGCKTTEANYAKAYQIAKEKRDAALTDEEITGMKREEAIPKTVYRGDSIPLRGMYVRHVEGAKPQQYTVVAATFKQLFNSRSVMSRLKDSGSWPAPLLFQDPRDKRYYVGAATYNSLDSAVAALHILQTASPVALSSPCPFILSR